MDRALFAPQIGDWVRIRTWNDMETEFGLNTDGSIACRFNFIEAMRCLEGCEYQITGISGSAYEGHGTEWNISKDMLEHCESRGVKEDAEFEVDTEALDSFLSSFNVV